MFNQYSVFYLKYMLLQKLLRKRIWFNSHVYFWRGWKLSLTTRNCYFPKTLRTNSSRFSVFSDTKNIIWYFLTCYMPLNWQSGQFHVFDNTKESNCPFEVIFTCVEPISILVDLFNVQLHQNIEATTFIEALFYNIIKKLLLSIYY